MGREIGAELRKLVAKRAYGRCEYCLIRDEDVWQVHQIDHIISRKHGGPDHEENLAYCCAVCNRYKGTDVGSLDLSGNLTLLFHPRQDRWEEHFSVVGAVLVPKSAKGEATLSLLRLNSAERIQERELLQQLGVYPRQ